MLSSATDWAWFAYWTLCGLLVGGLAREAERAASTLWPPWR